MVTFGWLQKGDNRIKMRHMSGERLEVGGQYLVPLVPADCGWAALSAGAIVPLDGDGRLAPDVERSENAAAKVLSGLSLEDFRTVISVTSPDHAAGDFAHLSPEDKVMAVYYDPPVEADNELRI